MRSILIWTSLAILGLALTVAVTVTASNLSGQSFALEGEPLESSQGLAPATTNAETTPAGSTRGTPKRKRPPKRSSTTSTRTTPPPKGLPAPTRTDPPQQSDAPPAITGPLTDDRGSESSENRSDDRSGGDD